MNYRLIYYLTITFAVIISSCNSLTKDHSLKPDAYVKLGMPDHKKVWTNDDYVASNITLSSMKISYPLSLPRKNSRKSGEVFSRFVSPENLNFIFDTIYPLSNRAFTIQYYPRIQSDMEQTYTIEYEGKPYYPEELADIQIFGLIIHDKMLELGWVISKSQDPDVEVMKKGMQSVQYNYLRLIPRLLEKFSESESYTTEGLERLSGAIAESIQRNVEWMDTSSRDSLETVFKNTSGNYKSGLVKDNLEKCIEILQAN